MVYSDTSSYNGDWKYGMRDGQGEFVMSDGTVYRGQWINDKPHGKGTLSIPYISYTYNGKLFYMQVSHHWHICGIVVDACWILTTLRV